MNRPSLLSIDENSPYVVRKLNFSKHFFTAYTKNSLYIITHNWLFSCWRGFRFSKNLSIFLNWSATEFMFSTNLSIFFNWYWRELSFSSVLSNRYRNSRNLSKIHSTSPVLLLEIPPVTPLYSVEDEYRTGEDLWEFFLRLESDSLGDLLAPVESPSR